MRHPSLPCESGARRLPLAILLAILAGCGPRIDRAAAASAAPPSRLADTGLYADPASREIAADVVAFEPNHPLWTDGARKRRWLRLPPGTAIDASDPDCWKFPPGTRLWKEFAFERPVETRYLELGSDGIWRYATYLWNDAGTEAVAAPAAGVKAVCDSGAGTRHDVPSIPDCHACHRSGRNEVLGFGAVQLAPRPAEDLPREPGSVDLPALVERGLLRGLPPRLVHASSIIAAATARGRAALGYLHGNCASCHNSAGPLGRTLGLDLEYVVDGSSGPPPAVASTVERPSRFRPAHDRSRPWVRIAPGHPEESVLFLRLTSRDPAVQMPPLGTHRVDPEAAALLAAWIRDDLPLAYSTGSTALAAGQQSEK